MIKQEYIYELIRNALNSSIQELDLDIDSQKELFTILREQALLPLLYTVYKDERFKKFYLSQIVHQSQVDEEVKTIIDEFENKGIDHILIKGVVLKELYPLSFPRSMGDVDILIDPPKREEVKEIMLRLNYQAANNWVYDDGYKKGNIEFEMHFALTDDRIKEASFFDDYWNHKILYQGKHSYIFKNEYNLVYLIHHLVKHILSNGVGIRPFVDIMLFLEKYKNDISIEIIDDYLNKLNYKKFFNIVLAFIEYAFKRKVLAYEKVDDKVLEEFGDYLLKCGIYGFGKSHNIAASQMASTKKSKKGYIWRKIFPPYKLMKAKYTYCRCPLLLPVGYIHRWFRILFVERSKVKIFNDADKNSVEQEKRLRQSIGLGENIYDI